MKFTKILKRFFELMLEEFKEQIDWEITAEKLNPIIERWIKDWLVYDEEDVQERIKQQLIKEFKSSKKIIEHDFQRLWLDYSPRNLSLNKTTNEIQQT